MESLFENRKDLLDEEIRDWQTTLKRALFRVENRIRERRSKPPLLRDTPVMIPVGQNADLFLLTWKIWCARYHVSIDFLLDWLLYKFRFHRTHHSEYISLGINLRVLTAPSTRRNFEEYLTTQNIITDSEDHSGETAIFTKDPIDFEDLNKFVENYRDHIEKSRRKHKREKIVQKESTRRFRSSVELPR